MQATTITTSDNPTHSNTDSQENYMKYKNKKNIRVDSCSVFIG